LNQSIDLTAIGRHSVFADQHVWIARTVEYVSQRTQGSIAVRRHPVERFADQRSKDDYESVVNVAARGSKRVRYIREDEDVNTYDLLRSAKVCVTYLSTVGLESTMLGVPTITVGHATYAGLGIVREPRDEQEYLDAIADALEGRMVVTQMQKEFASLMYYLTQVCNYCWSDFLPCPPFQNRWKSRSWKSFIGEPDVETIFTCALSGTPFALVEHERRFAAAKAGETRNL
jgi:capsule polysaccharide modification protein KpsS